MARRSTDRAGIKIEEYGDEFVWIAVQGVSRGKGQAEIKVSIPQARKLAIQLLQTAERQERQWESVKAYRLQSQGPPKRKRASTTRKAHKDNS